MATINNDIDRLKSVLEERESVRFVYVKKTDNSIREARGTRRLDCIPQWSIPKGHRKSPRSVLTYYDLDRQGWRCLLRDQLLGWIEEGS